MRGVAAVVMLCSVLGPLPLRARGLEAAPDQALSVLHITVAIADSNGRPTPVPRHALLISDNPASAPPRRILTSLEGGADVRLAPGNYTVESDRPVAFEGKSYQWTMIVDVVGGRDAALQLTGDNAEIGPITDAFSSNSAPLDADSSSLLATWQDSLVAIWTATAHGTGFVIDSNGLIAADPQVIGAASSVEVQLSPSVKVAGIVVASDARRGIALIKINPSTVGSVKAVPLECNEPPEPLAVDQEIIALEAPLGRLRGTSTGSVDGILPNAIQTDLVSSPGGSGGPAFALNGRLVGLTTLVPGRDGQRAGSTRIVRVEPLCELIALGAETIKNTPPPSAIHLPVEALGPFPSDPAEAGTTARAGGQGPYRLSTSDFDVMFITPAQLVAPQSRWNADDIMERLLTDFGNWSEYVAATPAVLLIRVTPKLVEGFWTKVARGAAMTQGMSIPPIKRLKPDFARMRALCGDAEIVPVHPFKLEHWLSDKDTLVEGLYAFDPGALSPACATVTLQLFSDKEPKKGDTVVVDPKVIQQIWQDLAPHRTRR